MGEADRISEPGAAAELPPAVRLLKRVVYIMGAVLVLLFVALIAGIVWKASHRKPEVAPAAQFLDLGLPAGTSVEHLALDGDRLAVDTGSEILVIDLKRNLVVSRLRIRPQ